MGRPFLIIGLRFEEMVSCLSEISFAAQDTHDHRLFELYSHGPHERAQFGDFKILPKQLEKYKVK